MTTRTFAVRDSMTMLRRNLLHAWRYPGLSIGVLAVPVIFLLLFVFVFGGALGAGIGGTDYVNYVAPGIILMTVGAGTTSTAVSVSMDMTEGIVARFRTMAIARVSILTGHVIGSVIQTMISLAMVIGIAVLVGFRPTANPVEWLAAIGVLVMLAYALTWLAVALGLLAKKPETASNLPLPLALLPVIGSGFVPTDSMPTAVRWFAEYQPFTPVTETVRGLLMGTPIGNSAAFSVAWSAGIALVGYMWAKALFNRDPSR